MNEVTLSKTNFKGCPVEVLMMGTQSGEYWGAFTPIVENIINKTITGKVLHLFSGRSLIGNERVDLERPEATIRQDVRDFIKTDKRHWTFVVLDPPYEQKRKSKLKDYAKPMALSSDVFFRREVIQYCLDHVDNILWLDYCAPNPKGFRRQKLWVLIQGAYFPVRILSWLKRETPLTKFA